MTWILLETLLIIERYFHNWWAGLAQRQGLFCLLPHPTSEQIGGAQKVGRRHSQGSWPPTDQKDIPHHLAPAQPVEPGEGKEGQDIPSDGICPPTSPLHIKESSFLGDGWACAYQWEVVSAFSIKLLISSLQFPHFLYFHFTSPSHQAEMSKWLCATQLVAGVKPWLLHYLPMDKFTLRGSREELYISSCHFLYRTY